MDSKEMRDYVVEAVRKLKTKAVSELNGNNFAGADIAITDNDDNLEIYRIIIIRHKY